VERAYMLRSITIDNEMLKWLASKLNDNVSEGKLITRSMLSNLIWEYEKRGKEHE
tara:strand:+ start:163 stop:327 length:165 start_codon:yes stop_codon:yes gene_type:complete